MKGKKYYLILIGLIVVGIGSIFLFRQQQESRFMEFEGYEIREIEARVNELYNEDKSDIVENISEEELIELDKEILELREQGFSKKNERRLDDVELDYLIARELNIIQLDISELFVEDDIVDKETTIAQIDGLEQQVLDFEIKEGFVERNMDILDNARDQIIDIEIATEYVEGLFNEEDVVRTDVTREEEEEALELIEPIRNEDIKDELIARVEVVSLTLTEMEEALALEEELEALEEEAEEVTEEIEEEGTGYSAPSTDGNSDSADSTWTPPSRPSQPTQPNPTPEESEVDSEPEPESETAPEPAPEPEPEPDFDPELEPELETDSELESEPAQELVKPEEPENSDEE